LGVNILEDASHRIGLLQIISLRYKLLNRDAGNSKDDSNGKIASNSRKPGTPTTQGTQTLQEGQQQ
jgi:hypothetical protein